MREPVEIVPNKVYTLDQAMEILQVSKPTIYRWCRDGRLLYSRPGRSYRFLGSALLSSLEMGSSAHAL